MNETARFLTENEVAEILRCRASKIHRLRKSGKLPYLPGRPVLIERADLDAYLASIRVEVVAATRGLSRDDALEKKQRQQAEETVAKMRVRRLKREAKKSWINR